MGRLRLTPDDTDLSLVPLHVIEELWELYGGNEEFLYRIREYSEEHIHKESTNG
jgi:hypothetical protein